MTNVVGPNDEPYCEYFAKWMDGQKELLEQLREALGNDVRETELRNLISKAQNHYEEYYAAKDNAANQNVLEVIKPPWRTPLENAFLWIGGWRPTMAFQLAYTQCGQHVQQELEEFLTGLDTPAMASLSSRQLAEINKLQVQTHQWEQSLDQRMASLQEAFTDESLLSLAQATADYGTNDSHHDVSLNIAVDDKVTALTELLVDANNLRLSTLRRMLTILTTLQATQFLVAAAQLHLVIRKVGLSR